MKRMTRRDAQSKRTRGNRGSKRQGVLIHKLRDGQNQPDMHSTLSVALENLPHLPLPTTSGHSPCLLGSGVPSSVALPCPRLCRPSSTSNHLTAPILLPPALTITPSLTSNSTVALSLRYYSCRCAFQFHIPVLYFT